MLRPWPWATGDLPTSEPDSPVSSLWPLAAARRVEEVCRRFEGAWRAGQRPRLEDYLGEAHEPEQPVLLRELLRRELACRRQSGETPTAAEYEQRFPEHAGPKGSRRGRAQRELKKGRQLNTGLARSGIELPPLFAQAHAANRAWRRQALAEGDLSGRARRRATAWKK